jgi:hypothetical protein
MQITPSHHPILNSNSMMKLYFWIHGFYYWSGCRVLWAELLAELVVAHMPGDAAPSYAVSGIQPEMPDCSTSCSQQITISGHRPDTSQIGAAPLYTRTNKY